MMNYLHLEERTPCPHLPTVREVIRPSSLKALKHGSDSLAYFQATLECAQSLWLCGLPAQSLLQLNFSLSLALSDEMALPYDAIHWIISQHEKEGFIANPVRHYQHLASRMSGKNPELRTLRAWLCFHMAEKVLPQEDFPRDLEQITKEDLVIPSLTELLAALHALGRSKEVATVTPLC